jgi:hypothetical protein
LLNPVPLGHLLASRALCPAARTVVDALVEEERTGSPRKLP